MKFHFVKTSVSVAIAIITVGLNVIIPNLSLAQSSRASEINRSATQALNSLYKNNPRAKTLGDKAVGVLIFPSIVKGGFIIAGHSVSPAAGNRRSLPLPPATATAAARRAARTRRNARAATSRSCPAAVT